MLRLLEIQPDEGNKYYRIEGLEVYKDLKGIGFGLALEIIQKTSFGLGMRLPQWKEDVVVRVQKPDANSKMTAPYLYVDSRFGRVPWKETMIEMFSNDWEIVE